MKTLVIGASGGFGGAVARELVARGYETTALVRRGGRDPGIEGLWQATGDALDAAAVTRAARDMDVIVFGFHVPYPQWDPTALEAIAIAAAAAAAAGATVIFPGNVYGLGGDFSGPLDEDCGRAAPTALGRIRNRMEATLREATSRGGRAVVLRAGDYFGAGAANTWFSHLAGKAAAGGAVLEASRGDVPHAWAYLPDVARAAVDLAERRATLEPYVEFHFGGHVLTGAEMSAAVQRVVGPRKVRRFPWWALRLASPAWAMGRALLSMRYLWEEPVLLDDTKLRALLGDALRITPLDDAVAAALGVHSEIETATAAQLAA